MSLPIGMWLGVDARTVDPLPPCPYPEEFAIYPKLYLRYNSGGLAHGQHVCVLVSDSDLYDGQWHGIVSREEGETTVALRAIWSGHPTNNGNLTVLSTRDY